MVDDDQKKAARAVHVRAGNSFEAAEILYGSQLYAECLVLVQRYLELQNKALLILAGKDQPEGGYARAVAEAYPGSPLLRDLNLEELQKQIDTLREEERRTPGDQRDFRRKVSGVFRDIESYFSRCDRYVRRETLTARQAKLRRWVYRCSVSAILLIAVAYGGYYFFYLRGRGLSGTYYRGTNFDKQVTTRLDDNIDFNFAAGRPRGIPDKLFSVRWEGRLYAPVKGRYEIIARVDDGARVFIDGEPVVDHWIPSPEADRSGHIELTKGWHDIKVEYFQDRYSAILRLYWKPPGAKRTIIPRSSLMPK